MQAKRRKRNSYQLQEPLLPGSSIRFQEYIREPYEGVFIGYAVGIYNVEQGILVLCIKFQLMTYLKVDFMEKEYFQEANLFGLQRTE